MKIRPFILLILFLSGLLVVLTACGSGDEQTSGQKSEEVEEGSVQQIRVGGAASTTFAYGFISSWAETLQNVNDNLNFVIQATPGSNVHYEMFEEDKIDMGAGFAPTEYMALEGDREPYVGEEFTKFRVIFPTTVSLAHVVTTEDSELETVQDLEGVNLGVPGRGSSTTLTAEYQLEALGVSPNFVYAQPDEMRNMLQDGRIDAFWHYTGAPYSGVLDLASQINLKFISFTEEDIKKIAEIEPYTSLGYLTSDHYDFVKEDVTTASTYPTVLASVDLDENLIYEITKTTWENWDKITELVPAAGQVTMDDVANLVGTLHPGALRYYEEEGIDIPDHLK